MGKMLNEAAVLVSGVTTLLYGGSRMIDTYDTAQEIRGRDQNIASDTLNYIGNLPHLGHMVFVETEIGAADEWERQALKALPMGALALTGGSVAASGLGKILRRGRK